MAQLFTSLSWLISFPVLFIVGLVAWSKLLLLQCEKEQALLENAVYKCWPQPQLPMRWRKRAAALKEQMSARGLMHLMDYYNETNAHAGRPNLYLTFVEEHGRYNYSMALMIIPRSVLLVSVPLPSLTGRSITARTVQTLLEDGTRLFTTAMPFAAPKKMPSGFIAQELAADATDAELFEKHLKLIAEHCSAGTAKIRPLLSPEAYLEDQRAQLRILSADARKKMEEQFREANIPN